MAGFPKYRSPGPQSSKSNYVDIPEGTQVIPFLGCWNKNRQGLPISHYKTDISVEDWEAMRQMTIDLYRNRDMRLNEIIAPICKEFEVRATERMFKTRIKTWQIEKNLKGPDVVIMHRVQEYYKGVDPTATVIFEIGNFPVDNGRLNTYMKRDSSFKSTVLKDELVHPDVMKRFQEMQHISIREIIYGDVEDRSRGSSPSKTSKKRNNSDGQANTQQRFVHQDHEGRQARNASYPPGTTVQQMPLPDLQPRVGSFQQQHEVQHQQEMLHHQSLQQQQEMQQQQDLQRQQEMQHHQGLQHHNVHRQQDMLHQQEMLHQQPIHPQGSMEHYASAEPRASIVTESTEDMYSHSPAEYSMPGNMFSSTVTAAPQVPFTQVDFSGMNSEPRYAPVDPSIHPNGFLASGNYPTAYPQAQVTAGPYYGTAAIHAPAPGVVNDVTYGTVSPAPSDHISGAAYIPSNGIAPNGMPQNGMPQNGMAQNGMPQNGMPQNGMAPNGMPLNGQNNTPNGQYPPQNPHWPSYY